MLPTDHNAFLAKAAKAGDPYEEIAAKVPDDIGQQISALKISGLNVYKENWRFYPGDDVASRTVGIMGYLGNDFAGRYGLESQYDTVLERTDESGVNFFAELFADIKSEESGQGEGDIVTSIEPTLQMYLQSELATTTAKWSSDYTGGIIMNPQNASAAHSIPVNRCTKDASPEPLFIASLKKASTIGIFKPMINSKNGSNTTGSHNMTQEKPCPSATRKISNTSKLMAA